MSTQAIKKVTKRLKHPIMKQALRVIEKEWLIIRYFLMTWRLTAFHTLAAAIGKAVATVDNRVRRTTSDHDEFDIWFRNIRIGKKM